MTRRTLRRSATIGAAGIGALLVAGSAAASEASERAVERTTPRRAVVGYLTACREGDYDRAAAYLDLGAGGAPTAAPRDLARQLKIALDRKLWVDVALLSDQPGGATDDALPEDRDLVGTIATEHGPVSIVVSRAPAAGDGAIRRFSPETVLLIPQLYAEFGYGPLAELLPDAAFRLRFLEIQLWQWLTLPIALAIASLAALIVAAILGRVLTRVLVRVRWTPSEQQLQPQLAAPLRLLATVALFYPALVGLHLTVPAHRLLTALSGAVAVFGVAWLASRALDYAAAALDVHYVSLGRLAARSFVGFGRRAALLAILMVALLGILHNLGINVTGLVAGLGVGGLAVALAAQKTIEHMFGAASLVADQPVRIGDVCKFGNQLGTVEEIGLRSTRIRTLDRTVVSVPNATFANLELENLGKRDRVRLFTTIGVRYETTPDQMRYLLIELRKLLLAHPKVNPDPARVRFVGFGESSLNIEVFAYVEADWAEFLAIREDLLLRFMEVVTASGTGFAFPSRTVYTAADSPLDAERRAAAERALDEWRAAAAMPLPHFTPQEIERLRGTLDYPPRGAAVRPAEEP